jgi:hypothetical protein
MAMQLPVIATPNALEGIESCPEMQHYIADNKTDLIKMTLALLAKDRQQDTKARDCVLTHYDWHQNLQKVSLLLKD